MLRGKQAQEIFRVWRFACAANGQIADGDGGAWKPLGGQPAAVEGGVAHTHDEVVKTGQRPQQALETLGGRHFLVHHLRLGSNGIRACRQSVP